MTTPFDFQGQGSKVKVTCNILLLNLVNTIQAEPFQLGPLNCIHTAYGKRTTPIDFQGQGSKVKGTTSIDLQVLGQRSRSHATH